MRRTLAILVAVLAAGAPLALPQPAAAQSTAETTQAIAALQADVDALRAQLAEARGAQPTKLLVYLDTPSAVHDGAIAISGWGFECETASRGTIEVAVDGVVVSSIGVWRWPRADVQAWAVWAGVCDYARTPYYSGAIAFVYLKHYAPGPHTIALRIRNSAGVVRTSNVRTINWSPE